MNKETIKEAVKMIFLSAYWLIASVTVGLAVSYLFVYIFSLIESFIR
jgi:hypothetical protein